MNIRFVSVISAALVISQFGASLAQEVSPKATEIIYRFVESLGGEMAMRSVDVFEVKGKRSGRHKENFTAIYGQGKYLFTIERENFPATLDGFDGKYVWQGLRMQETSQGFKRKNNILMKNRLETLAIHVAALDWLDFSGQVSVVDKSTIGEKEVWVLRFGIAEKSAYHLRSFDIGSGLLLKSRYFGPNDALLVENDFEYLTKSYRGVRFLSNIKRSLRNNSVQNIGFESINIEPEFKVNAFDIPSEIVDLKSPAKPGKGGRVRF